LLNGWRSLWPRLPRWPPSALCVSPLARHGGRRGARGRETASSIAAHRESGTSRSSHRLVSPASSRSSTGEEAGGIAHPHEDPCRASDRLAPLCIRNPHPRIVTVAIVSPRMMQGTRIDVGLRGVFPLPSPDHIWARTLVIHDGHPGIIHVGMLCRFGRDGQHFHAGRGCLVVGASPTVPMCVLPSNQRGPSMAPRHCKKTMSGFRASAGTTFHLVPVNGGLVVGAKPTVP